MTSRGSFQPKTFYDSMILGLAWDSCQHAYQLKSAMPRYYQQSSIQFSLLADFPPHPCNLTQFHIVEVPSLSLIVQCNIKSSVASKEKSRI